MKKSKHIVDNLLKDLVFCNRNNVKLIGIHIRSNKEYKNHMKVYNRNVVGVQYYQNAVSYILQKIHGKTVYLVVSDSQRDADKVIKVLKTFHPGESMVSDRVSNCSRNRLTLAHSMKRCLVYS